jgi:hypothetical protein
LLRRVRSAHTCACRQQRAGARRGIRPVR